MSDLQERRYKEKSPDKTVKQIKKILKENGIQVEENWLRKSSVGTYSLRLCIKGTNIGQNGKGMTKEFARASAYAEFMERYQNGMLVFRTEKKTKEFPFVYSADEKELRVEEIVKQEDSFIKEIYQNNEETGKGKQEILEEILGKDSKVITLPFYSVKDGKVVYIPNVLSCHLCGTNGMCAGNSPEEAIIEGISEILERYVSMQIIYQKVALPEVPSWYIEKYPKVQKLFSSLQNNKNYVVKLLDCSFGGKYPVAGLMIMQKNTGRFGFKLGAHPDYGIAMERCFTEASQGMDIYQYAQGCLFDFKNEDIMNQENIRDFVNSTIATIPYQVLSEEKSYPFTPIEDVSNLNNKEILEKMLTNLQKEGYDILVRDVSFFGFPSFRIIIPGMTEIEHTKMAGRYAEFERIEYLLKDFKRIRLENLEELIHLLEIEIEEVGFGSLYMFLNIKDVSLLPCEEIGCSLKYFLAICYIMKEDYKKAEKILEDILLLANQLIPNSQTIILLKAVYYYASAMEQLHAHSKVMNYLNILLNKEIADKIDKSFKEKENSLIRHYGITSKDYVEKDDSYYLPYMETLRKAQKENRIHQKNLAEILQKKENRKEVSYS